MFALTKMKSKKMEDSVRGTGGGGNVKGTNLMKVPPSHSALRFALELRHLEFKYGAAQYIGFEGGIQHCIEDDWAPHSVLSTKLTPWNDSPQVTLVAQKPG